MNRREFVQGVLGATAMSRGVLASSLPAGEPREIAYYLDSSAGSAGVLAMHAM